MRTVLFNKVFATSFVLFGLALATTAVIVWTKAFSGELNWSTVGATMETFFGGVSSLFGLIGIIAVALIAVAIIMWLSERNKLLMLLAVAVLVWLAWAFGPSLELQFNFWPILLVIVVTFIVSTIISLTSVRTRS